MKSTLFRLFALLVVISMIVAPVSAQSNTQGDTPQRPTQQLRTGDLQPAELSPKSSTFGEFKQELVFNEIEGATEPARYIIVLAEKPLATYAGDIDGLQATSPAVTGAKLDVKSAASTAYVNYLKAQQTKYLANVAATLGYAPEVNFQYQYATNGVSLTITPADAAKLAAQEGVKVYRAPIETPDTDEGPILIGAPAIWNGDTFDETATKGEDIIVGIIDTGINFDHPSFAQTSAADPYVYPVAAQFFGVCDPTNVDQYDAAYDTACNNKLIGAFTYVKDDPVESESPEDSEGHGSHTASTVAGNMVDVMYQGVATTIHGVAPHARIIAFDVCVPEEPNGACYGDATVAAVDDALITGVNVINYSISGGSNPYSDPVELAFLSATEAGIFVSTSAGNAGDTTGESSVAHRSPWVSTVAAATHARIFASAVDITGPGTVPPELVGLGAVQSGPVITADLLNLPIKYSPANLNGCAAFDANFFDGAFALIARGTCNFSVKEANAYAAGAEYVFIYNSRTGPPVGMSGIVTGAAMLSLEEGIAVKNWIDANPTATASMYAGTSKIVNPDWEDIIAAFSSYGPNTTFDVLKPDITGPGVNILAAVADDTIAPSGAYELELYQGTSMSSPHNAGAAALVMSLHPDWTPSQIKSAMMLTAEDGLLADRSAWGEGVRPATPQDEGSGRISLEDTALVGLTLDESIANYEAADPTLDGDPTALNLASLYSSKCVGECNWTRTFTSVAGLPATYTVTAPAWVTVVPAEFTIAAGATQEITFSADVSGFDADVWQFATIDFATDSVHPGTGAPAVVFSQDFTDATFPPTDWTAYDVDANGASALWLRDTTYSSSAPASARHQYGCSADQEGWLVTPQVSIPATGFTTFNFKQRGDWVGDLVYHGIWVSTATTAMADFVEVALPADPPEDAWSTAPVTVDLTAYAGQNIYVAFKYTGNCADTWWVDDVQVLNLAPGAPISDAHIPLAVLPSVSNIPDWVMFETNRDAGAGTIDNLEAGEITDGNVYLSGLTKANLDTVVLDPDPTNGDPIDDISQVYVKKLVVPAYSIRVVAEVTATSANDLDMFFYWDADGDGELTVDDYLVTSSATSAALEYINAPKDWIYYNAVDTYFVVVQNWAGAAGDTVTLATGMVPAFPDNGNFDVIVPVTNPALEPFSIEVDWNEDTEDGDRLYGYFDTCADTACDSWIGATDLDIRRGADDVVKTANVASAVPGDTITYTIEINNFTTEPLDYTINDVLPANVTYVPGSVTGGAVYDAGTNAITWAGTVDASYRDYVATTSAADPNCTLAIMADGDPTDDYLDWKTTSYGFSTASTISGDAFWYSTFATYAPFNFYGVNYVGMDFTADGYAGFDMAAVSNINQNLPDAANPNNVLAMFWDDFTVVYDAATNKGVTMVGDTSSFATIEYDDVTLNADPTKSMDMEVGYFLQPDDAPGAYEIVFAYDNITTGLLPAATGTIGVENAAGDTGLTVSYNDAALAIADGSAICFDWALLPSPPKVITFQVTVNTGAHGWVLNEAGHDSNALGTIEEFASALVTLPANVAPVAVDDDYNMDEDTTLTIDVLGGLLANDTDAESDPLTAVLVSDVTNGTLTLQADGSFVYVPDANYFGTDTFTYTANDPYDSSNIATVTITIADMPETSYIYLPVVLK